MIVSDVLREIMQSGPNCGTMGAYSAKGKIFIVEAEKEGRFKFVVKEKATGIVFGRAVEFRDFSDQVLLIDCEWLCEGKMCAFSSRTITQWQPYAPGGDK